MLILSLGDVEIVDVFIVVVVEVGIEWDVFGFGGGVEVVKDVL